MSNSLQESKHSGPAPVYLQAPHIITPSATEEKFNVYTIGELPSRTLANDHTVTITPKIISVPGIGPYNGALSGWSITPWLPPSPSRRSLSAWRTANYSCGGDGTVLEWDPQTAQFTSRFFHEMIWERKKLIYGIVMPGGSWSISRGTDIDSAPHCNHNGQYFPYSSKTDYMYRVNPEIEHNAVPVQTKLPYRRELQSAGFCPVSGNVLEYVTREEGDWTAHPVVLTRMVVCTMFRLTLEEVSRATTPRIFPN